MSQRGKELPKVTEEEEREIREDRHEILVRSTQTTGKSLHLTDGQADTLCSTRDELDFDMKTFAMYPPGYKTICRRCAKIWRDNNE